MQFREVTGQQSQQNYEINQDARMNEGQEKVDFIVGDIF